MMRKLNDNDEKIMTTYVIRTILIILLTTTLGDAETLTITDPVGDVSYDFIDIVQSNISANDTGLTVGIQLKNISKQLLFNKDNISYNMLEYGWTLNIGIDGQKYQISSMHFKLPIYTLGYNTLIGGTQHNLWKLEENGTGCIIGPIDAYVVENTLVMTTSFFNRSILDRATFSVETYYDNGNGQGESDTANNIVKPNNDILTYYRGMGQNINTVETDDLMKAADDWRNNIIPPGSGLSVVITTNQLMTLSDEWRSS